MRGLWGGVLLATAVGALMATKADAAASRHDEILAEVDSLRVKGRAESTLAAIDRALPEARALRDPDLLLDLHLRQGLLLVSIGAARRGEEVLRPVLAEARARRDSASVTAALRWLGVAVETQGRTDEAADLYREVLELAVLRRDQRHEGWARVGLAWHDLSRGRMSEALAGYRRAVSLFLESGDGRGEAWARVGLGAALARAGEAEEAREAYRSASSLAARVDYRMVQCLAENNLGALEYSIGDPALARSHFREAARLHREVGNIREVIIPAINLAICETELGQFDSAADSLLAMVALCRREGYRDLEAGVLVNLARLRVAQGRRREAMRLERSVLDRNPPALWHNQVDATIVLAESLVELDSCAAAVSLLEQALARPAAREDPPQRLQLERCLGQTLLAAGQPARATPSLRRAEALAHRLGRSTDRLRACVSLGQAHDALHQPDSARVEFERAARIWEAVRGLPSEPEWREQRGELGRLLCTDLARLLLEVGGVERAGGAPSPGADSRPSRVRVAYERAQAFKARTLFERMAGPLPAGHLEESWPGLTLDRLQREILREGELLLDFFVGPSVSLLFAVTRDSCRVVTLPGEQKLDPAARLYHDLLARPPAGQDVAAIRDAGMALGDGLLAPVDDLIADAGSVLVAADGSLNLLPFALLRFSSGMPREWTRVPSAAILARIRSRPTASGPPRVLALAAEQGPRGRLRGARREVEHLARRYRGVVPRILGDADSVRLDALTTGWSLLHLAGHAEVDDQHPWRSSIRLGQNRLRAASLSTARIPVRLAVLSSCETAQGRILSGEGVLGLSTALLGAGADCVVATLWPVDDQTCARLMKSFYARLAAGESVAASLREAQAAIRSDPGTAHPFYWAGYIAIGAGGEKVPLVRKTGPGRPVMAVAAALVLAALGGLVFRTRARRGDDPVIADREARPMG